VGFLTQIPLQTLTKDVDQLFANHLWQNIYEKRFRNKAKLESLPAHAPRIVQHVGSLLLKYFSLLDFFLVCDINNCELGLPSMSSINAS
jgi:hypothetical protein